jgi:hypothetical protein
MTPIQALLRLLKPKEQVKIENPEFKNVEWAFQFNEDEPVLLATPKKGTKTLSIYISNKKSSNIIFKDAKGNEFKIFAREQIENYSIGQKTI